MIPIRAHATFSTWFKVYFKIPLQDAIPVWLSPPVVACWFVQGKRKGLLKGRSLGASSATLSGTPVVSIYRALKTDLPRETGSLGSQVSPFPPTFGGQCKLGVTSSGVPWGHTAAQHTLDLCENRSSWTSRVQDTTRHLVVGLVIYKVLQIFRWWTRPQDCYYLGFDENQHPRSNFASVTCSSRMSANVLDSGCFSTSITDNMECCWSLKKKRYSVWSHIVPGLKTVFQKRL